jgi:molybdopterin-binding protein
MTVTANLRDALRLRGSPPPDAAVRIAAALDRLHVGQLAARQARTLSGGETQRVAIARALLLRTPVVLLDEPLSAADRPARIALEAILTELREAGTTICLSSHRLEDAYRWSSRIYTLVDGRLASVTPENLFRASLPPGEGTRTAHVGPLAIAVVSDKTGPVMLALPPEDLIVSRQPLTSSARNHFTGQVTSVAEDGRGRIRLVVDVGTDLIVRITPESLRELDIHVGVSVVLSIKAMAVRVF